MGVDVQGDRDLVSLWTEAREYLDTRHGRLKLLTQWVNDTSLNLIYPSYEALADALESTIQSERMKKYWRKRPAFTTAINRYFSGTWGGTRHRRHIVMSSVMREAVYAVTDASQGNAVFLAYNALIAMVEPKLQAANVEAAETRLVEVLHNNPANLVLDTGSWNTAIGVFAHNVRTALQNDIKTLLQSYKANPQQFFASLAKGLQVDLQKELAQFWYEYAKSNPPQDVAEFQELLYDMFDNAAVDLLSRQQVLQKDWMKPLLGCHVGFEQAYTTGNLTTLTNVCQTFIQMGLNYTPLRYPAVFK